MRWFCAIIILLLLSSISLGGYRPYVRYPQPIRYYPHPVRYYPVYNYYNIQYNYYPQYIVIYYVY